MANYTMTRGGVPQFNNNRGGAFDQKTAGIINTFVDWMKSPQVGYIDENMRYKKGRKQLPQPKASQVREKSNTVIEKREVNRVVEVDDRYQHQVEEQGMFIEFLLFIRIVSVRDREDCVRED